MLAASSPVATIILIGVIVFIAIYVSLAIKIVPQKTAYIVQRLGKYYTTLEAGFHIILPPFDRHLIKYSIVNIHTFFNSFAFMPA